MKILAITALSVPFVVPVMLAAPRASSGRAMSDDAVRAEAESDTVVTKFKKLYRKRDYSPRLRNPSTPVDSIAPDTVVAVSAESADIVDTVVVADEPSPGDTVAVKTLPLAAEISNARLGISGNGVWTPMKVSASAVVQGGNKFYVRYTLLHANGRPVSNPKAAKGKWVSAKKIITRTVRIDAEATVQAVTRDISIDIKRYLLQSIDLLSAVKVRVEILDADHKPLARLDTNTVKP